MNTNTAPTVRSRYFKPARRTVSPPSAGGISSFEKSLRQQSAQRTAAEMVAAYEGVQQEQKKPYLEIGECSYSLAFRTGVALNFPHLGGIIPMSQVDMIIDTALGIHIADKKECEVCERELPVIFKRSRIQDHRPLGQWVKEYFIICPTCLIFRFIREPIVQDADGMR